MVKKQLLHILNKFDALIEAENDRRIQTGESLHPKILIQILGQFSLLLHPEVNLNLAGTQDFDAKVKATENEYSLRKKLAGLLHEEGLELESDVHLIWIPSESTFTPILQTQRIRCEVLDPLFALCSKAVKAKEKNKILVRDALKVYGQPLRDLIEKHGGDCGYFE